MESQVLPYAYFKDTSPNDELPESVRGKHVYVVSDVFSNRKNTQNDPALVDDRYEYSR